MVTDVAAAEGYMAVGEKEEEAPMGEKAPG